MLNVRLFRLLSRSCFLALSVLLFGTVVSCPGTGTSISMDDNLYTGGGYFAERWERRFRQF